MKEAGTFPHMLLNCYWPSRVGGQTEEQTFTPLPSTEHFQRLCLPSPLRPPAPVSTSPSDPNPQGPAFRFRRSSVTRSSLCEEESSFSSAGSTAGLYLHKPWVSLSRPISSLVCKLMESGLQIKGWTSSLLICPLVAEQSRTSYTIGRWGADWGCVSWACCASAAQSGHRWGDGTTSCGQIIIKSLWNTEHCMRLNMNY